MFNVFIFLSSTHTAYLISNDLLPFWESILILLFNLIMCLSLNCFKLWHFLGFFLYFFVIQLIYPLWLFKYITAAFFAILFDKLIIKL